MKTDDLDIITIIPYSHYYWVGGGRGGHVSHSLVWVDVKELL